MEEGRLIVPGADVTRWSLEKLERAKRHSNELKRVLVGWTATDPLQVEGRTIDGGIEIVLRVTSPPPTTEASLIFGDLVHNLRSALDSAWWDLAHLDGKAPVKPKEVQLPVCNTEVAWAKVEASETDPELLRRIRALQPVHGRPGHMSFLSVLHNLDIQDKHKTSLRIEPVPLESTVDVQFFFDMDDSSMHSFDFGAVDGSVMGRLTTSSPIGEYVVRTKSLAVLNLVEVPDLGPKELWGLVDDLIAGTRSVLDILWGVEGTAYLDIPIE